MATLKQVYVMGKWTVVDGGPRLPEVAAVYAARAIDNHGAWSDMTEQTDGELSSLPVCIVMGVVTGAQLTAIQADSRFIVIGSRDIDSVTGATANGNFNATLTTPQVNAFKAWLTTNWPALPTATVNRCDTLVGMTRVNAARAVIGFIRRKADAGVAAVQDGK